MINRACRPSARPVALLICVFVALLVTTGCSSASTAPTTQTSLSRFPPGVPVDAIRRTAAPWVWDAVVADSTVALVESDSYGFPDLGQPQAQQQGTVKTLDLETGEVSTVSGGEISSPAGFSFWPWWFVAELPRAAGGAGAGPSVLWAVGNAEHGTDGIIRWQGLTGWTSSAGTKAVVGAETMTLAAHPHRRRRLRRASHLAWRRRCRSHPTCGAAYPVRSPVPR